MIEKEGKQLEFLAASYLECVSNELREKVSHEVLNKSYSDFKCDLNEFDYDKVLFSFKKITNSDMIIMFQVSGGTPIKEDTNYNQIVVLAESETERCIPILRSELLKYYRSESTVLSIKDSIRIVNVLSINDDDTVVSYKRPSCTVAFIEFGYGEELEPDKNRIYFALIFKTKYNNTYISIPEILPKIRNFLLYRLNLVGRINRDFKNNIYGIQKEELWKNQWLSIEKAGAHADSKLIDDIIDDSEFNNMCINTLFFENITIGGEKSNKNVLQLISNILIARYFRLIFSSNPNLWRCYDHIDESNYSLSNIVKFKSENKQLNFKNVCIPISYDEDVLSEWLLYYIESDKKYSGLPHDLKTTYSKKYLIAFLVDIFNNILKRGQNVVVSIEKTDSSQPAFLVIKNSVSASEFDKNNWNTFDEDQKKEYCYTLNYMLKQSIEFENANDQSIKRGISLGCLNHFMSYFGKMKVYYEFYDNNVWYCIKLPIIRNN